MQPFKATSSVYFLMGVGMETRGTGWQVLTSQAVQQQLAVRQPVRETSSLETLYQTHIRLPNRGPEFTSMAGPVVSFRGTSDRKSTRLNSSHLGISYAVFCLKKKK